MDIGSSVPPRRSSLPPNCDQIALVLQGGGALGAYQAGVYEGLHEAGLEPGWVAGVSIGSINGAIIAGNPPELRLARLREFWEMITARSIWPWTPDGDEPRKARNAWSAWLTTQSRPAGLLQASSSQSLVQQPRREDRDQLLRQLAVAGIPAAAPRLRAAEQPAAPASPRAPLMC